MATGTVKWFDDQKVEYELQEGRDGRESAVNLTLVG